MQIGDTARTFTGKIGVVIGFPAGADNNRRVRLEITCQFDDYGPPVLIRAAYDPRDVEAVDAERKPTRRERLERGIARLERRWSGGRVMTSISRIHHG